MMNNKQSWEEAWEEQFGGYWAIPMASDIDIKAMGGFKTEREAWEWIRTVYFCELCKQENEPLGCSRCECEWMVSDDKIDGHKEIKQFISALLDKREAEIRKEQEDYIKDLEKSVEILQTKGKLDKEYFDKIRKETIEAVLQLFDKYEGTDFKVKLNELYEMD